MLGIFVSSIYVILINRHFITPNEHLKQLSKKKKLTGKEKNNKYCGSSFKGLKDKTDICKLENCLRKIDRCNTEKDLFNKFCCYQISL